MVEADNQTLMQADSDAVIAKARGADNDKVRAKKAALTRERATAWFYLEADSTVGVGRDVMETWDDILYPVKRREQQT